MTEALQPKSMRTFNIIWFGQLISTFGSKLTGFALGVWVYNSTESVTQFGLVVLALTLPTLLTLPIAGTLIDRWDRRWVMILADAGSGLATLTVASLFYFGYLNLWTIIATQAISSVCVAFQYPAYQASITMLVRKENLGKANGRIELSDALAEVSSPLIAGLLLGLIGIAGVIFIDVLTFIIAVTTLTLVHIPRPQPDATEAEDEEEQSTLKESLKGWAYIKSHAGLLGLLLFLTLNTTLMAGINVLFPPFLLSFNTVEVTGIISTVYGVGALTGSIVMSSLGQVKRYTYLFIGFGILQGIVLALTGLWANAIFIGATMFFVGVCAPIINSSNQVLWQTKTPPHVQGRVFSLITMISYAITPLVIIVVGPLADNIFEPLLEENGALSGSLGQIMGTGSGRGIALMVILIGLTNIIVAISSFMYPRLRLLDTEVPDAVPNESIPGESPATT